VKSVPARLIAGCRKSFASKLLVHKQAWPTCWQKKEKCPLTRAVAEVIFCMMNIQ
jgi:hypothetical protein